MTRRFRQICCTKCKSHSAHVSPRRPPLASPCIHERNVVAGEAEAMTGVNSTSAFVSAEPVFPTADWAKPGLSFARHDAGRVRARPCYYFVSRRLAPATKCNLGDRIRSPAAGGRLRIASDGRGRPSGGGVSGLRRVRSGCLAGADQTEAHQADPEQRQRRRLGRGRHECPVNCHIIRCEAGTIEVERKGHCAG